MSFISYKTQKFATKDHAEHCIKFKSLLVPGLVLSLVGNGSSTVLCLLEKMTLVINAHHIELTWRQWEKLIRVIMRTSMTLKGIFQSNNIQCECQRVFNGLCAKLSSHSNVKQRKEGKAIMSYRN